MASCSLCEARVMWVKTVAGKSMPVELPPVPNGNVWVDGDGKAHVASNDHPVPEGTPSSRRYFAHFVNCSVYKAKKNLEAKLRPDKPAE